MALADRHTFQVLTKRADRMRAYFANEETLERIEEQLWDMHTDDTTNAMPIGPLRNVWLGVSVEDQKHADQRIPLLLQTPAAVRFISAEPLLGPVDVEPYVSRNVLGVNDASRGIDWVIVGGESGPGARPFNLAWAHSLVEQCKAAGVPVFVKQFGAVALSAEDGIGTAVTNFGGVTTRLRRGERGVDVRRLRDKKGSDPSEWPEDLRVREFPNRQPERD